MEEITLTVTKQEADYITNALATMPYGQVAVLINKVGTQIMLQMQPKTQEGNNNLVK